MLHQAVAIKKVNKSNVFFIVVEIYFNIQLQNNNQTRLN